MQNSFHMLESLSFRDDLLQWSCHINLDLLWESSPSNANISISILGMSVLLVQYQVLVTGEMYNSQVPEDGEGSSEAWTTTIQ